MNVGQTVLSRFCTPCGHYHRGANWRCRITGTSGEVTSFYTKKRCIYIWGLTNIINVLRLTAESHHNSKVISNWYFKFLSVKQVNCILKNMEVIGLIVIIKLYCFRFLWGKIELINAGFKNVGHFSKASWTIWVGGRKEDGRSVYEWDSVVRSPITSRIQTSHSEPLKHIRQCLLLSYSTSCSIKKLNK